MFTFTDPDLANTLCWIASREDKKHPPVQVRLLIDRGEEEDPFSDEFLEQFTRNGVSVHLHRPEKNDLLHMKTAVIDGKTVLTGAANWSRMAFWRNIEDVLIIRNEIIASTYQSRIIALAQKIPLWQPPQEGKRRRGRPPAPPSDPAKLLSGDWLRKAERSRGIRAFSLPDLENFSIHFTPEDPFVPRIKTLLSETQRSLLAAFFLYSHYHIQKPLLEKVPAITAETSWTKRPSISIPCLCNAARRCRRLF